MFYLRTITSFTSYYIDPDNTIDMETSETITILPCDAVPADYEENPTGIKILDLTVIHPPPTLPPPATNFNEDLLTQESWESELFHTLDLRCDVYKIIELLSQCTFRTASDGSVHDNMEAAFAWVLSVNGH